jgi:hypothetical protein
MTKANPSAIAIGVENPWDNKNKGQSEKPIVSPLQKRTEVP